MVNEYSKQSHRYTEGNRIGSMSWTGYVEKGRSLDNTVGGQPAGKSLKRRAAESFGFTGVPFPSELPNEFAYLDFKKWAYKNRGKIKKDLQKYTDTKIFKRMEYWWTIWDKKTNKGQYSNIKGNKFGRELIRLMWSDGLIFDNSGNRITKLKEIMMENYDLDNHPKKKWIAQKLASINPKIMDELFRMYSAVYSAEGMQLSAFSASELQSSYQIVMLIDIDKDPMPDAFIFTRGNRVKLLATDGQKLSRSLVIRKVVKMVNSGYNLEASAKMETIMKAKGAPYIDDENRIKNMVGSKFIEYLGDGYYKRKLKKGGTVVKRMYGK